MDNPIPKKTSYLVPSLTLVEEEQDDDVKTSTESISYILKQKAGATGSTASTYKIYVKRFDENSVQSWIILRQKLVEIWTQNGVNSPSNRTATIRAVLRGESLTCFNASVEEQMTVENDQGVVTIMPLTLALVEAGMEAVAETVFPFRALTNQKVWMRRGMKKPKELSFRKTASAVGRLNNALPLFPKATAADKFNNDKIVELLEWSIPQAWRTKFDIAGYVPTEHPKSRLITECEILERNEPSTQGLKTKSTKYKDKAHKKASVPKHNGNKKTPGKKGFYCTEHGENPTHNTDNCYTIKNRAKKASGDNATLTKKSFRREINLLSKHKPKKKVLEMFAVILSEERDKASKKKKDRATSQKKRKATTVVASSSKSSSDEEEIHVMDQMEELKSQLAHAKKRKSDESTEEKAYNETLKSLGEPREENREDHSN